jgi:hypothetical protein
MNSNSTQSAVATTLVFQSTEFDIISRDGQPWLRGRQIDSALGYKRDSTSRIYERNKSEFTDSMTCTVKLTDQGQSREVRIFSLRGAHLLAMFARSKIAGIFRKWVLDILDAQMEIPALPAPTSITSMRWITSFSPIDKQEIVKPIPADALVMTIPELCRAVTSGEIVGQNFTDLAFAVNQYQFMGALQSKQRGYGYEVAQKLKDVSDADLYAINVEASQQVWLRTERTSQPAISKVDDAIRSIHRTIKTLSADA